ncbi:MAG: DUF4445 domain-containing protein [Planctomycetota bacterium]|nr:DUF4445 domain-containing protein [Planctomycetota bacterium]
MLRVKILPDDKTIEVLDGETVFDACCRAGIMIQSACGGVGTCTKCVVRIKEGATAPSPHGVRNLSSTEIEQGYRLSCQLKVRNDLVVEIPPGSRFYGEQILTVGGAAAPETALDPSVRQYYCQLPQPEIHDQASDFDRLARALGAHAPDLVAGLDPLRELADALREKDFRVTATVSGRRLIRAEPGNTRGTAFGVAYDIGTTTVVGYLIDLTTGKELALASRSNPQAAFGHDVLARGDYADKGPQERRELQDLIVGCMQEIAAECCEKARTPIDHVYEVVFGGNTIMTHLVFALNPRHITVSPFTPIWSRAYKVPAHEIGLKLAPGATVYALPSVGGYVGGDITAGMLACDLDRREDLTLFVDVGTNGEILLGNRSRLISCAAPAGPAFEGAKISCGLRAMSGAIDKVSFSESEQDLDLHVIGHHPPRGVCGTGLIDAVATFLKTGMVDPGGRVLEPDEAREKLPEKLAGRVLPSENGSDLLLVPKAKTLERRRDLTLTQRDIRELQLAKGAIRAGVDMALKVWGVDGSQVSNVLIAGGFGNYINPAAAMAIGLFPPDITVDKLEFVGNSAAVGAKLCLVNRGQRARVERLAREVEYIELSGRKDFADVFMTAMLFPGYEGL